MILGCDDVVLPSSQRLEKLWPGTKGNANVLTSPITVNGELSSVMDIWYLPVCLTLQRAVHTLQQVPFLTFLYFLLLSQGLVHSPNFSKVIV